MTKRKGCLFHDLSLNFASFSKHGLHYCINEMRYSLQKISKAELSGAVFFCRKDVTLNARDGRQHSQSGAKWNIKIYTEHQGRQYFGEK